MDKILNITHGKENPIEFDVKVDGIKTENLKVYFDIHTNKFSIGITCNQVGDKWIAVIPPLNFLEKTMYDFTVIVVADGYYFEPFKGSVNIVTSPEIYVTMDKSEKVKPSENVVSKGPIKQSDILKKSSMFSKSEPKKDEPKEELKKDEPKDEPKKEVDLFDRSKDKKIKSILDSMTMDGESYIVIEPKKVSFKNSIKPDIIESNLDATPDLNIKDIKIQDILDDLKVKDKTKKLKGQVKPVAIKVI